MNIQAEELLAYLEKEESRLNQNEYKDGFSSCIVSIKFFIKNKADSITNV
jgi:hypothetical protein